MQKITPFLWFEKGAKEAADFYVSVFSAGGAEAKVTSEQIMNNTPSGTVEIMTVNLGGQDMTLMAAGPFMKINSAVSFVIDCKDQAEVDHYWSALSAVPSAEQCGWLTDKFGVTWQVVPRALNELMSKDSTGRVQAAMLQMKKIVIADLEAAYKG